MWLVLGLALGGPLTHASEPLREQIETALGKQMQQLVTQQNWSTPSVQLHHELPAHLPAQPCTQPLLLKRSGVDPSPLARQRFVVSCGDGAGWQLNASSQATVFVPVVFASAVLERGQSIAAGDVQLKPVNIGKVSRGYFSRIDQVVGLSAKRRIRDGQQISPALLTGAVLVKRGQPVDIQASQDGIQAHAKGEALSNGQLGEVIRVRNLSSEKIIDAKVIEAGVVSSTFR